MFPEVVSFVLDANGKQSAASSDVAMKKRINELIKLCLRSYTQF